MGFAALNPSYATDSWFRFPPDWGRAPVVKAPYCGATVASILATAHGFLPMKQFLLPMLVAFAAGLGGAAAAEPTAAGLWQKSDNGKPVIWVLMSERNGTFEG